MYCKKASCVGLKTCRDQLTFRTERRQRKREQKEDLGGLFLVKRRRWHRTLCCCFLLLLVVVGCRFVVVCCRFVLKHKKISKAFRFISDIRPVKRREGQQQIHDLCSCHQIYWEIVCLQAPQVCASWEIPLHCRCG